VALRFFADHCISSQVVNTLRAAGHEVLRLKEHMPAESPDLAVIAKAQELGAMVLSLNGDFADIVAYPPGQFGGIVALQIRDHPEITSAVVQRLLLYAAAHPHQQDYRGKLLLVEAHRLRVRE
jgi:predicted nuclease of predicted toxin-antitoxin system